MKTTMRLTVAAFVLAAFNLSAATLLVSLDSPNPTPPYTNWITAATNIQDAVDAAVVGDEIVVTNGVYGTGGGRIYGGATNRVVMDKPVLVRSVNGPEATFIDGLGAMRCVYLTNNAALVGFTVTNRWSSQYLSPFVGIGYGGGVFCESTNVFLTNCVIVGNLSWAGGAGGGVYQGTLYDCTLTGNSVSIVFGEGAGGGAYGSTLYNCTLTGNWSAGAAGGAYGSTLYNCTLIGNYSVGGGGGGADRSTLYGCTLSGNKAIGRGAAYGWAADGGGARSSTLYNCTLTSNESSDYGGGASGCTLYNCTVSGNSARIGGGAGGTLYNCLITDNNGGSGGFLYGCTVVGNNGGVSGTVFNSIVYGNTNGNYTEETILNYCLTTPLPTNGIGNITGPPLFMDYAAGDYRLWENSPCIDAGRDLTVLNVGYTFEPTDILGNTRFIDGDFDGTVAWDIGAYEFNSYKPPRFSSPPRLTANGWQLNITGAHNKWVRLQRSSDLRSWEDVGWPAWVWMGSEGVKQVNDGDMGQRMMFYRVVVE
jgi:hypothetical protein